MATLEELQDALANADAAGAAGDAQQLADAIVSMQSQPIQQPSNDGLPTADGVAPISNEVFPQAVPQNTDITSQAIGAISNIAGAPVVRQVLGVDVPQLLRATASGVAAAPFELANLPFVANEGLVNFVLQNTGHNKIDGVGSINNRAIVDLKDKLAGDISGNPNAKIAQTAGEFLGFGVAARLVTKGLINPQSVALNESTKVQDAVAGAAFEKVEGDTDSTGLGFGASVAATLLFARSGKSALTINNQVEQETVDVIRQVKGAADKGLANLNLAGEADIATNMAIATEIPVLSASLNNAKNSSVEFSNVAANVENVVQAEANLLSRDLANAADFTTAGQLLNRSKEKLTSAINEEIRVSQQAIAEGKLSVGEASQAIGEHISIISSSVRGTGQKLYDVSKDAIKGKVVSPNGIKEIRQSLNELTNLPTVRKSDGILLTPAVKEAEALIRNELGDKISKDITKTLTNGKVLTLRRGGKVTDGSRKIPIEAVSAIRTSILEGVRAIKTANGGEGTEMSRRLSDIAGTLTKELELTPELAKANVFWRTMNETFNEGQLASFLKTRLSGDAKLSGERIFTSFLTGTSKLDNIKALDVATSVKFNDSPELRAALVNSVERAFSSSLAAKLLDKERLTVAEWRSWRTRNLDALKEFDARFGTTMEDKFGNFQKATVQANEAKASLSELEATAFAEVGLGNIDKVSREAILNNNIKEVVNGMPTKTLRNAMARRIGSDLINFNKSILSPQRLVKAIKDNANVLRRGLGKKNFIRMSIIAKEMDRAIPNAAVLRGVSNKLNLDKDVIRKLSNIATAVIGSVKRRGFKALLVVSDLNASRNAVKAFELAMYDEPTMRRLLNIAKKQPSDFIDLSALAMLPAANKSTQDVNQ